MSKINICNILDCILTICDDINKLEFHSYKEETLKKIIDDYIKRIQNSTGEALQRGQAMENRLIEYRKAIEQLGFKRKK